MNESVFQAINKVYVMLLGIKDSGGKVTEADLNLIIGLLEGTLGPFTISPAEVAQLEKSPWWRKFLP